MQRIIDENKLILAEGAVVERLRRSNDIELHPELVNAPLIYDDIGRSALSEIYHSYIDIAQEANIPFFMVTPTWRANRFRISESGIDNTINIDAVKFMKEVRDSREHFAMSIKIGGLIGCRNDCYRAEEGLSAVEAEEFHSWQIDQLAQGGVDFLIAQTLPNVNEALGIARAMEKTGTPYFISFVISGDGFVLDGTSLYDAVNIVDEGISNPPIGYMVNCAYPTFLCAENQPKELFNRFIGYQGNASSLDHGELEGSETLKADSVPDWGSAMLDLNRSFGVKILGGCCGTGVDHLRFITENYYY
ncbi:MAG: homocysteine S-methyltransferase family protein [bacterium]|nr:homocysteine S-methyltransferase family protein [bacterium]